MYAWFSKKQRDNWNMFYREVSNNKVKQKHIYYIDYSDNINGYNSFKIKDNKVINYNINQLKKFYFTHFLNNKNTI